MTLPPYFITRTLGNIGGRLDVIEERSVTGDNRRGRLRQNQLADIGVGDEEAGEHLGGGRNRQNERVMGELTKRMEVEVSDFNGKFGLDVFHVWLVFLEDYFE